MLLHSYHMLYSSHNLAEVDNIINKFAPDLSQRFDYTLGIKGDSVQINNMYNW